MVAAQIAAADVPVILQPMTNLPAQFSQLHARYDNATLLHAAGVRIVITTDGAHGLRNLRQEAGNAIASGLPVDAALRALTVEPARVFGVEDRYGAVAPGRVAPLFSDCRLVPAGQYPFPSVGCRHRPCGNRSTPPTKNRWLLSQSVTLTRRISSMEFGKSESHPPVPKPTCPKTSRWRKLKR